MCYFCDQAEVIIQLEPLSLPPKPVARGALMALMLPAAHLWGQLEP